MNVHIAIKRIKDAIKKRCGFSYRVLLRGEPRKWKPL